MEELEYGIRIVELKEGFFVVATINGVLKYTQPQTLQTPDVPCLLIYFTEREQPIVIAYETEEERDEELNKVKQAILDYKY